MSETLPSLAIVVPCFNEEEVIRITAAQLTAAVSDMMTKELISPDSRVYFVDDGSSDGTWSIIQNISSQDSNVGGIKLSRNRGHQNALLAGLLTVAEDMVISIDADLQDDVSVIEKMVTEYRNGNEIVYGVRGKREVDSVFKKLSAEAYYGLLAIMGVETVFNHADFRLIGRRALNALGEYQEINLFLRGIVPTLGFPSTCVTYDRSARVAGETKYPLRKMLALAVDGITSFSAVPLRLIAVLGLVIFALSLLTSAWVLWVRLFSGQAVPGWASSVLPMYLLGGVQLLSLGIIGEYVAKIYVETKRRPRFIVEKVI